MDQHPSRNILDLPKVVAVGIASPMAALLTSAFGVAGTLLGLALSAVIVCVFTDLLKGYVARASGALPIIVPGGFRKTPRWRDLLRPRRLAVSKASSLPRARRRPVLISVVASGVAFLVGLSVVTGVEWGAGKSLSCWVWKQCPSAASSAAMGGKAASTSTLPSLFGGGGRTASGDAPQDVGPQTPQQQPPLTPPSGLREGPSQPSNAPASEEFAAPPQPRQPESPSGILQEARPSAPNKSEAQQRQSPGAATPQGAEDVR